MAGAAPDPARANRTIVRAALIGGVVLAGLAVALWARYGGVVFMETMANAWAYCF